MPKTRRQYTGNAVSTTITGNLAAGGTSVAIASDTGWPTSAPFYVVIDPGTASEEKMYVSAKSTLTLTVTRGQDGTSDVQHSSGATIYPVFTAVDADEANELTAKYTTRGDIVYQGASTFERLAKGTQHHVLRAGANDPEYGLITNSNVDASAAIALSKLATGALPTAITVASANLVDGTIVEADLADGAVTSAKILDGTIVNADINASAAIVDTKLDTISTANKVSVAALDIDGATDIGADLADADLVIVDDGAGGTNRKSAISRFAKYLFGKVSGDFTISDSGVATIGAGQVENSMLAANAAWTTFGSTANFKTVSNPQPNVGSTGSWTMLYQQIGKTVFGRGRITLNGTGVSAGTGAYRIDLPVTAKSSSAGGSIGVGSMVDSLTTTYPFVFTLASTTQAAIYFFTTLGTTEPFETGGSPFTLGAGDFIDFTFTYEAA